MVTITIELPESISVYCSKLGDSVLVPTAGVDAAKVIRLMKRGLADRLQDAAAGKTGEAARSKIEKRIKTVWDDGGTRGTGSALTAELMTIVLEYAKKHDIKRKTLPTKQGAFYAWFMATALIPDAEKQRLVKTAQQVLDLKRNLAEMEEEPEEETEEEEETETEEEEDEETEEDEEE